MQSSPPHAESGHDPGLTPEPETVEDAVMVAIVRAGKRLRHRFLGEDLDFSTFVLLKTVAHRGPMRLNALATVLDLDASTVSRHVKSLEDRDLLERTTDPDDGRAFQVAVTDHGTARLEAGAAQRRELIGSALADWDAQDREDLRRLLHQLTVALENQDTHR